ncbi:hypothetical protein FRC03_007189 [Tulasnella sp. 419]|nr:hypothetical protein FRC03_007189 [Tulasnella sp. 419]
MMSSKPVATGPPKPSFRSAAHPEGEVSNQQVLTQSTTQLSQEDRLDWVARIRSKLFQFEKSYTVLLFFGEPPADEHNWRTSDQFVGSSFVFANSSPESCDNCIERTDAIVEGFIDLTPYLKRIYPDSLDPEIIVPYLKDKIHWRIQKVIGHLRRK